MRSLCLLIFTIALINSQEDIKELKEHLEHTCENPTHKHYDKVTLSYITPW